MQNGTRVHKILPAALLVLISLSVVAQSDSSGTLSPASIDSSILEFSKKSPVFQLNVPGMFVFPPDSIPVYSELVYEARMAELNLRSPIDLEYNKHVKKYIDLYTLKRRGLIAKMQGMSRFYFPVFEAALDKYQLPMELKYLAVIESALNPTARSHSGAVGLWQFILPTGQLMDLKVSSFIDERMDPVKSTDAACRYLEFLYNTFKDWQLAIAAYNGGPGTVRNAIVRSGGKTTFWEIRPYLPAETQGYVPAFIAMVYAMEYAPEHNIKAEVPKLFFYQADTVLIKDAVYFTSIASKLGIPIETIRFLNPSYKMNYIPRSTSPQALVLPANKITAFIEQQKDIVSFSFPASDEKKDKELPVQDKTMVTYVVKKGDYLHKLALDYRCSMEDVKAWNNLTSDALPTGSTLVLWVPSTMAETFQDEQPRKEEQITTFFYTVQKGDTIYSIAQKFKGSSVDNIMALNQINNESGMMPGTVLKIQVVAP